MNEQELEKIKKAKILIVEDDVMLVKFLKDKLQREGILDVEAAVYSEEATEKMRKKKPDLILLDLILPKKDGFEFLKEIRGKEETKNIPVIVMSNLTHDDDKNKALKLKVDGYLIKSEADPGEIVERVTTCLAKHLLK